MIMKDKINYVLFFYIVEQTNINVKDLCKINFKIVELKERRRKKHKKKDLISKC